LSCKYEQNIVVIIHQGDTHFRAQRQISIE